jgi:cell division transport system permease protein
MQRRRIEVEVLKLVGASDTYVLRPFVIEGAAQGTVGAILGTLLLGILYLIVQSQFDAELAVLMGVRPSFLPWYFVLAMIASGGLMGAIASYGSLRRLLVV